MYNYSGTNNKFIILQYFVYMLKKGIGIDAHICLKFHEIRERYPNLFKSRV